MMIQLDPTADGTHEPEGSGAWGQFVEKVNKLETPQERRAELGPYIKIWMFALVLTGWMFAKPAEGGPVAGVWVLAVGMVLREVKALILREREDLNRLWLWLILMVLFLLPASLMANSGAVGLGVADLGGKLFLFVLWMGGWYFLRHWNKMKKLATPTQYLEDGSVDYEAQMPSMPSAPHFP